MLHARFSIGVLQVDDRDTSGSCQLEGVSTNTRLVRNIRRIFTSILSPNDKNAHGLLEILPKDHPGVLGIDGFDDIGSGIDVLLHLASDLFTESVGVIRSRILDAVELLEREVQLRSHGVVDDDTGHTSLCTGTDRKLLGLKHLEDFDDAADDGVVQLFIAQERDAQGHIGSCDLVWCVFGRDPSTTASTSAALPITATATAIVTAVVIPVVTTPTVVSLVITTTATVAVATTLVFVRIVRHVFSPLIFG